MSQKPDNAAGRLGRGSVSPTNKKHRDRTPLRAKPPPQSNREGPTTAWLSCTACSHDQLNSVDIDRRGESGEQSSSTDEEADEEVH